MSRMDDAVKIFVNVGGEILVNGIGHFGGVKSACRHVRANHDGVSSCLEGADGVLSFSMGIVALDGSGR